MEIHGKVILITGASEGIGLATARRFAREGAKLALVSRSAHRLEQIAEELRGQGVDAIAVPVDLRHPDQARQAVEETIRHFGRIDVLINNAGQAAAGTVERLDLEDFRAIIELNVYGPFIAMQAAIPVMREHGGGMIVNVSSMVSKMHIPGLGSYAATKAALNLLSDTARVELAGDNIRVITMFPRMTSTDFGAHSRGNREMRGHQRTASSVPVDTPEQVAEKILAAVVDEPEEQYMDR